MSTHIYFDLDGTLTDPYDGITRSILFALEHFDVPSPGHAKLAGYIGPGLRDTFRDLVGAANAEHALALYRERYSQIGWRENTPYDGIHNVLESLAAAGHTLFVATAKPHVFARKIIEYFKMAKYFTAIYGSELDGTRGDKTELLGWAIPQYSADQRTIMVGDRIHDIVAARNNKMDAIGVAYGYGSVDELAGAGAGCIVYKPDELPAVLL